MKKLTTEDFIERSNKKHNGIYDYSKSIYINSSIKLIIVCKEHGEFEQVAGSHMLGQGCPKCNGGIKYTLDEYINKFNIEHNGIYDYSNITEIEYNTKINIICNKHGEFKQLPNNHARGQGCPICYSKYKEGKMPQEVFIEKCREIHGDTYDYSKAIYKSPFDKTIIICKEHGEFEQAPNNHINQKQRCPKCFATPKSNNIDFIEKSKKIHGDKYDYSKVEYIGAHSKVIITCPKHGDFEQKPTKHLSSRGCPVCKFSRGETKIFNILKENNIEFIYQHRFDNFRLVYDFYLPGLNLCIEYDGVQHHRPVNYFGGKEEFMNQIKRDKRKDIYCIKNNINLLRISYIDNILEKLNETYFKF